MYCTATFVTDIQKICTVALLPIIKPSVTHCLIISSMTSSLSPDLMHAYTFSLYFPFTSFCNPHVLFLTSTVVPPVTLCTSFCKLPVLLPVLSLHFFIKLFLYSPCTSSCPPLLLLPVLPLYFILSSPYTSSYPTLIHILPVLPLYFFPILPLSSSCPSLIFFLSSPYISSYPTLILFLSSTYTSSYPALPSSCPILILLTILP